jgi:hypothetical protein
MSASVRWGASSCCIWQHLKSCLKNKYFYFCLCFLLHSATRVYGAYFCAAQERLCISRIFSEGRAWHDPWLGEDATIKPGGSV